MNGILKISLSLATVMLWQVHPCFAQKGKKGKENLRESTPYKAPNKHKDTIPIIYERIPAKEKPKEIIEPIYKTRDTIIGPVGEKKPAFRKDIPIVFDTVRNKPRKRLGAEEIIEDRKTITIEMSKPSTGKTPIIKDTISNAMLQEGNCKCVAMEIKVQDTIEYENYINYRFIFVNKCKEMVLIHSGSFRFLVNDYFGHPATRVRRVDFVKRFDYPEYVRVSPGETYEFNFADDPFFEFQMNRSQQYRFNFMYNNTHTAAVEKKGKPAPRAHQCLEVREKVVYVK